VRSAIPWVVAFLAADVAGASVVAIGWLVLDLPVASIVGGAVGAWVGTFLVLSGRVRRRDAAP